MLLIATYPTVVMERWEYLPALLLVMILMPLIYWCILTMLFRQQELYEAKQQEQLLLTQSVMLKQRIEQASRNDSEIAIQRHDLRHRFHTLDAMPEKGDVKQVREYITSSQETFAETTVKRWCLNPVLDTAFSANFRKAEDDGIKIEANLDIPADIPVNAVELSTVFANALENAIHAVAKLLQEQRVIRCRCISLPQLMFYVSNPYSGEVRFDENNRPITDSTLHGIGTRSIAAYGEKYGAACDYSAENGWFSIRIVQTIWTE